MTPAHPPADLDPGLGQADLQSHLLPGEEVGVAGAAEERLQQVQLGTGEGGSLPPLLPHKRWREEATKEAVKETSHPSQLLYLLTSL